MNHSDPFSLFDSPPVEGHLRMSASVLDQLVTVAASDVQGVMDTQNLVEGALVGGIIGGAVGFAQAGPAGAAFGAPLGSAAGAAAAHWMAERRAGLVALDGRVAPALEVRVVARYGEDLNALSERVRASIEAALRDTLGLEPGPITVEIVDVVDPGNEMPDAPAVPAPVADPDTTFPAPSPR